MREIARQKCILGFFFGFFQRSIADAPKPTFTQKYTKPRGSVQGCAFSGLEKNNLPFKPPYFRKIAIFAPAFDGT